MGGGVGIIEMMYKTNIFGLVGGGKNPKYTPNKVILWDDYQTKVLNELPSSILIGTTILSFIKGFLASIKLIFLSSISKLFLLSVTRNDSSGLENIPLLSSAILF